MTTTEHLQLIKAECERLLAIAEKRTQGEWKCDPILQRRDWEPHLPSGSVDIGYATARGMTCDDAAYIAACAARAEAGWRSTIAAIDAYFSHQGLDFHVTQSILAAWPIELLTQ